MHRLFGLLLLAACAADPEPRPLPGPTTPGRTVAVTIDDLPTVAVRTLDGMRQVTNGIVGHLTAFDVPAIGFVNERKLGTPAPDPERVALLQRWIDAGLDLGNHTFSHPSLFDTPLDDFKAEVRRGEIVTDRLLEMRGDSARYFRHPYLNTGPDAATKTAFEAFLDDEGYTVAPVTIDNDEYVYALAYRRAMEAGDDSLAARIGDDYVRYMEEMFVFFEELSHDLFGREPAQTLLIHANTLNADYLDDLIRMMMRRGYRFVSLEEALEDPAYDEPDGYTGRTGFSWLQRWQVSRGLELTHGPDPPDWLMRAAYPDR